MSWEACITRSLLLLRVGNKPDIFISPKVTLEVVFMLCGKDKTISPLAGATVIWLAVPVILFTSLWRDKILQTWSYES